MIFHMNLTNQLYKKRRVEVVSIKKIEFLRRLKKQVRNAFQTNPREIAVFLEEIMMIMILLVCVLGVEPRIAWKRSYFLQTHTHTHGIKQDGQKTFSAWKGRTAVDKIKRGKRMRPRYYESRRKAKLTSKIGKELDGERRRRSQKDELRDGEAEGEKKGELARRS